jgi:putative nucleotidyltransferase with HDIG domain
VATEIETQTDPAPKPSTYDQLLEVLGVALDFRDNETAGHARRVARYSFEIAKAIGCDSELLLNINRGAYLHDLGKIAIPDGILLKKGKLTAKEWEVMRTHTWIGYNLISRISLLAPVAEILLTHHERYDGAGYPRGLKGDAIPLGARIFAIADTLDAMTCDRPYRKALPYSAARQEITREAGRQFDPEIVKAFLSIPEEDLRGLLLSEKRRTVRLPLVAEVACKAGEKQHNLTSVNICEGGMLLEGADGLPIGEVMEIRFTLPGFSPPMELRARTVRRDLPDRVAIAFQKLSAEHLEAIQNYIAARVEV